MELTSWKFILIGYDMDPGVTTRQTEPESDRAQLELAQIMSREATEIENKTCI